jgi:hypothetical protein
MSGSSYEGGASYPKRAGLNATLIEPDEDIGLLLTKCPAK